MPTVLAVPTMLAVRDVLRVLGTLTLLYARPARSLLAAHLLRRRRRAGRIAAHRRHAQGA